MQRRHFETIAHAVKDTRAKADIDTTSLLVFVSQLADTLQETNPRFRRDQFMVACGFTTATGLATWTRPRREVPHAQA
jgi:hypothetical protein